MVDFVTVDRDRLRAVYLVHGDPDRQAALTDALEGAGVSRVEAPERGRSVTL